MSNSRVELESIKRNINVYSTVTDNFLSDLAEFKPTDELSDLSCPIAYGRVSQDIPFTADCSSLPYFLAIYCIEGSLQLKQNDKAFIVPAFNFLMIDCRHGFSIMSLMLPCRFRLCFIKAVVPGCLEKIIADPSPVTLAVDQSSVLNLTFLSSFRKSISFAEALKLHELITTLFTSYCMHLSESSRDPHSSLDLPGHVTAMYDLIHSDDPRIFSLSDLEEKLGINRFRLVHDYTKAYGISPMKDLNDHRIERAKKLLLSSPHKVKEICNIVGFEDTTHFIRLFKKNTGMTPGAYRKKYCI